MTANRIALALLCFALAAPTAANAGLITWELEGTIGAVSASSTPFLQGSDNPEILRQLEDVGVVSRAGWRARLTFDPEASGVPYPGNDGFLEFPGASTRFEFFAGDFVAVTPHGVAGTAAAGESTSIPSFYSSELSFQAPMGNDSETLHMDSAWLFFASNDAMQRIPASLPSVPPDPSQFSAWHPYSATYSRFSLYGHGLAPDDDPLSGTLVEIPIGIDLRITSIMAVPEPSLLVLVVAAAATTAIRRRSRALP